MVPLEDRKRTLQKILENELLIEDGGIATLVIADFQEKYDSNARNPRWEVNKIPQGPKQSPFSGVRNKAAFALLQP